MKLGLENKKETAFAAVLLVLAVFALYTWLRPGDETSQTPASAAPVSSAAQLASKQPAKPGTKKGGPVLLAQSLDPTLRLDLLKSGEEVSYQGSGRDIFQSQPDQPKIPEPITPPIKPGPVAPPPPPPIPLKFYGFSGNKSGPKQVFLSKGDDIFVAKEGQIIDRRYKILKIGPNSVEVEDVLNNNRQTLPLTAS